MAADRRVTLVVGGAEFDPLMTQFSFAMVAGMVIDVFVIPWGYVLAEYVRAPAEPIRNWCTVT